MLPADAAAQAVADRGVLELKYLDYRDWQPGASRMTVRSPSLYTLIPVNETTEFEGSLVYDAAWLQEHVLDDDDHEAVRGAMGSNMRGRGLCSECGRPDLSGTTADDFDSEEDARELAEMYAEQAAELRAGC